MKYRKSRPNPTPEQEPPAGACAIVLTRGYVTWVDECDFEALNAHHWQAAFRGRSVYAARALREGGKVVGIAYIHRLVMPDAAEVDHREHWDAIKVVDNRRSNLRVATSQQNHRNMRKFRTARTSKFKGVMYDKERERWRASITINYRTKQLGRFRTEIEAAHAYDRKARELFGEFARLNFQVPRNDGTMVSVML